MTQRFGGTWWWVPVIVVVVAVIVCVTIFDDPDAPVIVANHAAGGDELQTDSASHGTASASRRGLAEAQPGRADVTDDCAWFDPWREETVSRSTVARLLEEVGPLDPDRVACLPAEWTFVALLAICQGAVDSSREERAVLERALASSAPAALDSLGAAAALPADGDSLTCVLRGLLDSGADSRVVGRVCGHLLLAMYGDRGSFLEADPDVVLALGRLLAELPIRDEALWEGIWAGMPLDAFNETLNVRLALYEALGELLSTDEWTHRLSLLAGLDPRNGVTLMSMAQCIGRRVPLADFSTLLAIANDPTWRQTLVHALPDEARWPFGDRDAVPQSLLEELTILRDSPEYPYRNEITMFQWELFGPERAAADLADFVAESDRGDPAWPSTAGAQVFAVLRAVSWSTSADSAHLGRARELVRELVVSSDPQDVARLFESLSASYSLQSPHRECFAEILGPDAVAALTPDQRAWLGAD